jgi:hypothetical protein
MDPKGKPSTVNNKKISIGNCAVQGINDKKYTKRLRCGLSRAEHTAIVVQLKVKQIGKTLLIGK